jgi:hypothetical protein
MRYKQEAMVHEILFAILSYHKAGDGPLDRDCFLRLANQETTLWAERFTSFSCVFHLATTFTKSKQTISIALHEGNVSIFKNA